MFTLAYLSHVLLGSEDQFKVHYPLGELLEQTAVRVDMNRLERDEGGGDKAKRRGINIHAIIQESNYVCCAVWSHTQDTCWCFTVLYTPPLDSRAVW